MKKLLLTLGSLAFYLAIQGQAGSLDLSFGTNGFVRTNFPVGAPTTYSSSAVQPDGKIVAVGTVDNNFAIARYNINGTLDNSFSDDGMMTVDFDSRADFAADVAIQLDGKIVVAGSSSIENNSDFAAARINPDGSLDNSFSGDGKVLTDIAGFADFGVAVAIQPDGKILVGGTGLFALTTLDQNLTVLRYFSDGTLDPSFSDDGIAHDAFSSTEASDMVLQPDGKIVIVGTMNVPGPFRLQNIVMARFNSDGTPDISTVTNINFIDVAAAVTLQSDGKIIVAGRTGTFTGPVTVLTFGVLIRYNTDGSLDNSFSGDGILIVESFSGISGFSSVVVQPDGKIIAGGLAVFFAGNDFVLVRYTPEGTRDMSFGPFGIGVVFTDFENGSENLNDLCIHNDRLYAVGTTTTPSVFYVSGLIAAYSLNDECEISVTIPDAVTLDNGVEPNTVYLGYQHASDLTLSIEAQGANLPLVSVLWSNGATSPDITVTPTVPTTYTVNVTDALGCTGTASKFVNVVDVRCGNKLDKVEICKVPQGNPSNAKTNCISASAVPAQLSNGSYLGSCKSDLITGMSNRKEAFEQGSSGLIAFPNPSPNQFSIIYKSRENLPVELEVRDVLGKLIEKRRVAANVSIELGMSYKPGIYLLRARQGSTVSTIRLVRAST